MDITVEQLSEAIRKNGYPQIRGQYVRRSFESGEVIGACALGQAALNLNIEPDNLYMQFAEGKNIVDSEDERYQKYIYRYGPHDCPICGILNYSLTDTIMHLNDVHRMTITQIADWVDNENTSEPLWEGYE